MRHLLYLSHPEVAIDPQTPVPEWGLSDKGRARVVAARQQGWPGAGWQIWASPEVKAQETARLLGAAFSTHPAMAEVDRSSTGYVPHDRHEALADALFARPGQGPEGWESALDAQKRITGAMQDALQSCQGDVLMVGHGAVGTLLWCHLTGAPIAREQDQRRGGSVWHVMLNDARVVPVHAWRDLETCGPSDPRLIPGAAADRKS